MGEIDKSQVHEEEPVHSQQPFRFAGVELKPDDDPNDEVRKRVKRVRWVNLISSIVAGILPLIVERWLAGTGLLDLSSRYPFSIRDLLLFYIGWAMYWGIRDVIRADNMEEHHPLEGFTHGVLNAHWIFGGYLLRPVLIVIVFILYNLLGGGIYGVYQLVRQSKDDLAELGANKSVTK